MLRICVDILEDFLFEGSEYPVSKMIEILSKRSVRVPWKITTAIVLFAFSMFLDETNGFTVLSPAAIAGTYYGAAILQGAAPSQFNFTGRVVQSNPWDACSSLSSSQSFSGLIVLIGPGNC